MRDVSVAQCVTTMLQTTRASEITRPPARAAAAVAAGGGAARGDSSQKWGTYQKGEVSLGTLASESESVHLPSFE